MISKEKLKMLAKLQQKKYRDQTGKYIIEGPHLVEEALKNAKNEILEIFSISDSHQNATVISPEEMKKITSTDTLCTICALMKQNTSLHSIDENLIIALDGVQDPGNLGTIMRSMISFGCHQLILGNGTVDAYNSKVVRSSQGAIFQMHLQENSLLSTIKEYKEKGYTIYGTALEHGIPLQEMLPAVSEKKLLILGNEGNGVSKEVLSLCDQNIFIEMSGIDSLNVGVAGSILLYEMTQKQQKK